MATGSKSDTYWKAKSVSYLPRTLVCECPQMVLCNQYFWTWYFQMHSIYKYVLKISLDSISCVLREYYFIHRESNRDFWNAVYISKWARFCPRGYFCPPRHILSDSAVNIISNMQSYRPMNFTWLITQF